ncbi:uncharacterized protein F5Z01DRAFT_515607 [Emericellopsis atlantica]|uniref:Uncharacterized protein n=1 Tax=Emericellopsis atlantica TaxID=2614577 RepID=A0A9P7ZD83_9HYPO|nr:uncharacterized protein F5Z01DRAFT_515607 [Emericellopsis atlantica]KAG9249410.1 hypothetical protein F5Z01DRAFT_515607 [Emericellopsis atlantica]
MAERSPSNRWLLAERQNLSQGVTSWIVRDDRQSGNLGAQPLVHLWSQTPAMGNGKGPPKKQDAVSAYCLVQEGTMRQSLPKVSLSKTPSNGSEDGLLYCATLSVYARNKKRPRRCFVCIGYACGLLPDDPWANILTRSRRG